MESKVNQNQSDSEKIKETTTEHTDKTNLDKFSDSLYNLKMNDDVNPDDKNDQSEEEEFIDAKENYDSDELNEETELNDETMNERHKDLSESELKKLKEDALELKNKGNEYFKNADYLKAIRVYTQALNSCPLNFSSDRSILFANRAAARVNLDNKDAAVLDCNKALDLNPTYMKALLRRAQLHRKLENLEQSLADYQKIMELDRNNDEARYECSVLPGEIAERNEKLKTEMLGKLKELGNLCLRPFGLSTDNFNMVQDPKTGGYSINFQK